MLHVTSPHLVRLSTSRCVYGVGKKLYSILWLAAAFHSRKLENHILRHFAVRAPFLKLTSVVFDWNIGSVWTKNKVRLFLFLYVGQPNHPTAADSALCELMWITYATAGSNTSLNSIHFGRLTSIGKLENALLLNEGEVWTHNNAIIPSQDWGFPTSQYFYSDQQVNRQPN